MCTEIIKEMLYKTPIEELDMSIRSLNCLKRADINTVKDLVSLTEDELYNVRNFGKKSSEEIIYKLASLGLSLKKCDTASVGDSVSMDTIDETEDFESTKLSLYNSQQLEQIKNNPAVKASILSFVKTVSIIDELINGTIDVDFEGRACFCKF